MDAFLAQQVWRAIAEAKGNATLAQRRLRQMAEQDPKLLHALVAPFLNGIVAHVVQAAKPPAKPATPATPKPLSTAALDGLLSQLGRNIGRVAEPAPRGMNALVTAAPEVPRAGTQHETTMRMLAAAFRKQPKR